MGCIMAWLELRGERFRVVFRFGGERLHINLKNSVKEDAPFEEVFEPSVNLRQLELVLVAQVASIRRRAAS